MKSAVIYWSAGASSRKIFTWALALLLLAALCLPARPSAAQEVDAAAFTGIDDARLQSIVRNEGEGKIVIVTFFASWCAPCRKEIPQLVRLRSKVSEEEMLILGINFDHNLDDLNRFLRRVKINFPVYFGESNLFTSKGSRIEIRAIPRMFIYDAAGKQVQDIEGVLPEATFDRMIDYLLESAL